VEILEAAFVAQDLEYQRIDLCRPRASIPAALWAVAYAEFLSGVPPIRLP
jgi:hypothetical protein